MGHELLPPHSGTNRVTDSSLVRESLRQAGQDLVAAGRNWESKLQEAAKLRSGLRGLLPSNRRKADELVRSVQKDVRNGRVIDAAQTFDEERETLNDWF